MEIFEDMYKTGVIPKKILNIRKKQILYSHSVANFCNRGENCFTNYKYQDSVKQKNIFNDYIINNKILCDYSY